MPATTTRILNKRQVRQAAKMWRDEPGRNGFRESRMYDVIVDGKPYPPKAIAAYANEAAGHGILLPRDFAGAREGKWHRELARLGFRIEEKSSSVPEPVSDLSDTILGFRDDERFLDCPRAFLVTGTKKHDKQNRSLLELNQSGYWFLKAGRVARGDALFIILPSVAPGGYPREIYCGVVSEEPNRELHGGKVRFQVDQFHMVGSIASHVKEFLGNRLPPQGDRVSNVWDDAEARSELAIADGMGSDDDEDYYPEGAESFKQHKTRERSRKVVELAKVRRFKATKKLECDACGFDFLEVYGERGRGFIEAHHTIPFASKDGPTRVRIKDFALVCSNCHRMLHRMKPLMTTEELKAQLQTIEAMK